MSSKNRILLDFNAQKDNKIKHLSIHPRKDYIGILTITNNFSLWNYKQKILLKSFSCNSLDDNINVNNNINNNNNSLSNNNIKQVQIKESLFYDRYSLPITGFSGGNINASNVSGFGNSNSSSFSKGNHNTNSFPNLNSISSSSNYTSLSNMKNNIIFVTPQRIFLYDYVTDVIKSINQKQLQQKNIRKVAIYSQNKICIVLNDGSFKVLDIQKLYSKQEQPQATIKTFKGYHTKPINWIFAYSQNINQMPRVITVSGSDGLMACWNVDSMLQSSLSGGGFNKSQKHLSNNQQNTNTVSPCFKFIMTKGSKNDSNNGQQIISLQYDPSSYHLVTLTQSYLTIWSTMTGMQLKRVKNTLKLKQIVFFNHFSFANGSFIGHTYGSILYIVRYLYSPEGTINGIQIQDEINLKQFVQQNDLQIINIKNIPQYPANLFIITSTDLLIMQIDKFYRTSFGIHPSFTTKLTTFNSRNFIKKGQGQFKKPIMKKQIQNMQFPQDILFNTFYLSYENNWIYFHLIQLQYKNVTLIFIYICIDDTLKSQIQITKNRKQLNSQTQVKINFDGKQLFLFNKNLSYYQVYGVINRQYQENNLIGGNTIENQNIIDFYHSLESLQTGICRNIVWHQYKAQYAAICPFDKNGNLVSYVVSSSSLNQKQKKGIFSNTQGGSSKAKGNNLEIKKTGEIFSWYVCIFEKVSSTSNLNQKSKYQIIFKSPMIQTKLFSLFASGQQYAYSSFITKQSDKQKIINNNLSTSSQQCLQYISSSASTSTSSSSSTSNSNNNNPITPQKLYISYCETYHIYCYQGYFIIYKIQQNGSLSYYKTIQETILEGLFWQKFFFYVTKNGIYFLQLLNQKYLTVSIQIADNVNYSKTGGSLFNSNQIDKYFTQKQQEIQANINNIRNNSSKSLSYLSHQDQLSSPQSQYQTIFQDLQNQSQFHHILPQGQIQIISIVNMHLLVINQIGRQYFLNLKYFPYIQFCLEICSGYLEKAGYIYKKSSLEMRELMKDTLSSYGLILSSIMY